jgi:hypothetical protein
LHTRCEVCCFLIVCQQSISYLAIDMIANTAVNAGLARGLGSSRLPAFPRTSAQQQQRRVVVRFKESDNETDLQKEVQTSLQDVQQELGQLPISSGPTGSKLTPEQLQQVGVR